MRAFELLQLEWMKFQKNNTFKLSLILYAVLLISLPTAILSFNTFPEPLPQPKSFFDFPLIYDYIGYAGNWLAFFIFGFLGVYIISADKTYKTLRQSVIHGLTRKDVFLGKVMFLLAIALAATLFYLLSVWILGAFGSSPYSGELMGEDYILFRYFLMVFAYLFFGFLIGLVIGSIGVATLVYYLYVFMVELILRYLVHLNIFNDRSMLFYPMNAVEDLTPSPFFDPEMSSQATQMGFSIYLTAPEATITSGIYTLLFIVLAYLYLNKKDL